MIALVLGLGAITGCASTHVPASPDGSIVGEGTVHRGVGPECPDTWHVKTSDGTMLWPVEDIVFRVEGLPVRFTARERNLVSICMAGKTVEFVRLEKR